MKSFCDLLVVDTTSRGRQSHGMVLFKGWKVQTWQEMTGEKREMQQRSNIRLAPECWGLWFCLYDLCHQNPPFQSVKMI